LLNVTWARAEVADNESAATTRAKTTRQQLERPSATGMFHSPKETREGGQDVRPEGYNVKFGEIVTGKVWWRVGSEGDGSRGGMDGKKISRRRGRLIVLQVIFRTSFTIDSGLGETDTNRHLNDTQPTHERHTRWESGTVCLFNCQRTPNGYQNTAWAQNRQQKSSGFVSERGNAVKEFRK
jgi:hypothetical protein